LWVYPQEAVPDQLPYLLLLGAVTTALGHTLFLTSFSHFNISTASIMSSIQPLFGVLIAMVFLSEIPSLKSVLGGVLILTTVVLENWRVKEKNKKGKTYL
jgi:drug/metabolite transporter (DMT)-like permease